VTIKAVLWAPAFAGVGWLRLAEASDKRAEFLRLAGCGAAAGGVFVILLGLHSLSLEAPGAVQIATAGLGTAHGATSYVFQFGVPFYTYYLVHNVAASPLQAFFIFFAPIAVVCSGLSRDRK